jgi:hypothetical protein
LLPGKKAKPLFSLLSETRNTNGIKLEKGTANPSTLNGAP